MDRLMPTTHFPYLTKIALHHLTIQKHNGIQRLILIAAATFSFTARWVRNSLISSSPILAGCRHPHLFDPDAVVFEADYIADLIEEFLLAHISRLW